MWPGGESEGQGGGSKSSENSERGERFREFYRKGSKFENFDAMKFSTEMH